MSELMLDVDQAGELKAAFRRTRGSNGSEWTNGDIKKLSEGAFLGLVLDVLQGRAEVVHHKKNEAQLIPGRFFMTVSLGNYSSIVDLRQAILSSGKKISDYANQILNNSRLCLNKVDIDLWEVSGKELGFTEPVTRRKIYERAREVGFDLCPEEAIALARIKCDDKKFRIGGMEPIAVSDGIYLLGLKGGDDGLWLRADYASDYGSSSSIRHPDNIWLFARPRRK